MTVSVSIGSNPTPSTGSAPTQRDLALGGAGPFASMLALTAAPAASTPDADPAALPTTPAPQVPAAPTLTVADVVDLPNDSPVTTTVTGKSLLKDLGDALIAINDALEAGKPVDATLEKKLSDSVDAIATYLGTLTQPAPVIDPRIIALANGKGILPAKPQPELTADAATPAADGAATPVDPSTVPNTGTAVIPTPTAAPAFPAGTPASGENENTGGWRDSVAAPDRLKARGPMGLSRLADLVDEIATRLEAQSPELAEKLKALVGGFRPAATPPSTARLALDASVAAPADDPEITRIVDALSDPKAKAVAAQPALPFTAPRLELPPAVPGKTAAADTVSTPPAGPAASPIASPDAAAEPEVTVDAPVARPALAARPADNNALVEPDRKPVEVAPAPPPAAVSTPSADAQPPSAPQLQPAPVARTALAAYQTPVQQVNVPQVAFEVVRQFEAGNTRFQIRLDPPELGRIDVKLDVDKTGNINARMTVERPETLDLMQRDQRALQQALQQAGLDASKTSLEFSLRQNPFAQQGGMADGRGNQPGYAGSAVVPSGEDAQADLATANYRGAASTSGVNLFV